MPDKIKRPIISSGGELQKSRTLSRSLPGVAYLLAVVLAAVLALPNCNNGNQTEGMAAGDSKTLAPSLDNAEFALQTFLEQGCNALLHGNDPAAAIAYFEEAESIIEAAGLDERLKELPVLQLARRAKSKGLEGDFPMEDFYWESARQKDLPTGYLAYLQKFPDGKYAGEARKKLGQ